MLLVSVIRGDLYKIQFHFSVKLVIGSAVIFLLPPTNDTHSAAVAIPLTVKYGTNLYFTFFQTNKIAVSLSKKE